MKVDYQSLPLEQMPAVYIDRINRFDRLFKEGKGHSFKQDDLYSYELNCMRQSLSIIDFLETKENPKEYFKELCGKYPSLYDLVEYLEKEEDVWIDDGHSGNSMGSSWLMVRCYMESPELFPYLHGSLAQLVGDDGYCDDRSDVPK